MGHSKEVWSLCQCGDKVISGGGDSAIKIWGAATDELE